MKHDLDLYKKYYFDYLHFVIKLCIYHIRKKNYPLDHWNENLKNSLKQKNNYAIKIKNYKPQQLNLF